MKTLTTLLIAILIVSCSESKPEPEPIKIIFHELIFQDDQVSFYHFTARNESNVPVDSFRVEISLYSDDIFQDKQTIRWAEELIPYAVADFGVVFNVSVPDSLVTFKYKFK